MKRNINEAIHQRRRSFASSSRGVGGNLEITQKNGREMKCERSNSSSETTIRRRDKSRLPFWKIIANQKEFHGCRERIFIWLWELTFYCRSWCTNCLRLEWQFPERFVKSPSNYCPLRNFPRIQYSLASRQ